MPIHIAGLELARVPRVPGTRRNSEHHLWHPLILRFLRQLNSDATIGWTGLALAHLEFGSSVNPITTTGADYAHDITASSLTRI